jgi:hypothetical protein
MHVVRRKTWYNMLTSTGSTQLTATRHHGPDFFRNVLAIHHGDSFTSGGGAGHAPLSHRCSGQHELSSFIEVVGQDASVAHILIGMDCDLDAIAPAATKSEVAKEL